MKVLIDGRFVLIWGKVYILHRSQSLFYFVPQDDSHSQAGSTLPIHEYSARGSWRAFQVEELGSPWFGGGPAPKWWLQLSHERNSTLTTSDPNIADCICPKCKMHLYLSKSQIVFVNIVTCTQVVITTFPREELNRAFLLFSLNQLQNVFVQFTKCICKNLSQTHQQDPLSGVAIELSFTFWEEQSSSSSLTKLLASSSCLILATLNCK